MKWSYFLWVINKMFSLSIERQSKIIVLLKSCFLPSQDTDHSLSLINWQGTSPTVNHWLLFRNIFRVKTNCFFFSGTIQIFIMRQNSKEFPRIGIMNRFHEQIPQKKLFVEDYGAIIHRLFYLVFKSEKCFLRNCQ
jgi:hypothetical protein